jgi:hypothetical protein
MCTLKSKSLFGFGLHLIIRQCDINGLVFIESVNHGVHFFDKIDPFGHSFVVVLLEDGGESICHGVCLAAYALLLLLIL